jgi:predicted PhzF superfamily epimerase YddE/YHI9
MSYRYFVIDTFTSKPFSGNPTGVCCIDSYSTAAAMQSIASELSFPVTAFINQLEGNTYSIRYFTPVTEIPACGHATLAASQVVYTLNGYTGIRFHTIQDTIIATSVVKDKVFMRYPKYSLADYTVDPVISESLGSPEFHMIGYCRELESIFLETDSTTLYDLKPNFRRMEIYPHGVKEVVITCTSSDSRYDYLLRSFCPWIGIDEDPVTGSVQSVLAQYWGKRSNKKQLHAYQASARGGEIEVRLLDNHVEIAGQCKLILEGTLLSTVP